MFVLRKQHQIHSRYLHQSFDRSIYDCGNGEEKNNKQTHYAEDVHLAHRLINSEREFT